MRMLVGRSLPTTHKRNFTGKQKMAADSVSNNDWVEAEIARQLEQISLDDDSGEEEEEEVECSTQWQVVPGDYSRPEIGSPIPFSAHSAFTNYIKVLSNEHTAVDNTLVEAQGALVKRQDNQLSAQVTCCPLVSDGEPQGQQNLESFNCHHEVTDCLRPAVSGSSITGNSPTADDQIHTEGAGLSNGSVEECVSQSMSGRVDNVSEFREETKEVKCTVEKYKLERLLLEEKLSREQQQREADLNDMIKDSIEKRRQQERVMMERAKINERRRVKAAVLVQAGARGYLTRKKVIPRLAAAKEKKRLEREKERERVRTRSAITVQALWRGYRSRLKFQEGLQFKRDTDLKREQAATELQAWWRGCRAKRAFLKLKDEKLQEEALSAQPHDSEEGKLTVTKRIQSALKIKKQSSLSEMPGGPSTQASMSAASEETPDIHNDQQQAITDTYRAPALDKVLPPTCTHTPSEKLPSSCTSEMEDPLLRGNTSEHSHSQRKSPSAVQLHVSPTEEQHCVYRHSHQQKSVTFGDLVTRVDELDDEQSTLSERSLEKKLFSQSPQTSIRNLATKSDRQCNLYAQSNDSNSDLDYDQSSTSAALSPRKNNSSLSPKMPAQQLLSNTVDGSGSVVVKLMRSLSESNRKSLMLQLQQNSSISPSDGSELGGSNRSKEELLLQPSDMKMPPDTSQKDKIFDAVQTESESAPTSTSTCTSCTKMATSQETSTAKTVSEREAFQGPCVSTPHDQNTPLEKENQGQPVSSKEQMLAEEQRALALLVERRETEELVAQLSRQRMNSLISEEELAKVAKRKRSHSTYRQELEHACTPLLPHAWLGIIEERMLEWKKHHQRWNRPTKCQREIPNLLENRVDISNASKSDLQSKSVNRFSSNTVNNNSLHSISLSPSGSQFHANTKLLSDAQLLAASPRGTRLEEVACVMLYRSRGDVRIPQIGRKCPRLCTLNLTKCGAMKMVETNKEEVGGVWEELIELNLQSNMMEQVDCNSMKELRFVDLSDNRLASIHGLDHCPHLLELCLSDNRIARVSGGLPKHSGLQVLDIDSNLLINCRGLEDLPLLQRFSCAENHLPKVDGLANCRLLQYLRLSQNNLQLHPNMCDHVLLRELYLDENNLSDVTAITKSWLPLLQTLSLSNNCITELSSLTCLVMLKTLDVSNNSLYDLPLLLQSMRGCLQLQTLHLHGNPVTQESKFRAYLSKALHSLLEVDGEPVAKRNKVMTTIQSSPIYQLCCRQLEEQDGLKQQQQMELEELKSDGTDTPSLDNTRKILMTKISHCHNYEKLLIQHLREHEGVAVSRNKTTTTKVIAVESTEDRKHELRVKAATLIQSLVRGWLVRRRVVRMRQHKAATVIQSHYRGYLLRRRLKEVLERAHYIVSGDEREGSVDDEDLEFEEEVIGLDYLDEGLLDADIKPLSPTDEHVLMKYTTRQLLRTGSGNSSSLHEEQDQESRPQQLLVPAFSLPGAAAEEVSFEVWKQQEKNLPPANQPSHFTNTSSFSRPTSHPPERDPRTHGESSPTGYGYSETHGEMEGEEVQVHIATPEICEPRVQQAWGSQTQLPSGEEPSGGCKTTPDRTSSRTSSTSSADVRDTPKKDKIISDWGFQSSTTADLMLKRMQRQKKLHSNAVRRQKLHDPGQRLALFHKHKSKSDPTMNPLSMKSKARPRLPSSHTTQSTYTVKEKEHSLFQWVHEQHLVHSREGSRATKGKSSFLPSMEAHILAGHKPRLMTSAHQNELVESLNKHS